MSTKKPRATRGNIGLEAVEGRLRLIVPAKHSPTGEQKRIALGMKDTPENRGEADKIIKRIHAHIQLIGDYDPQKLEEYIWGKPENTANKLPPTQAKELQLDELWTLFVDHKSKSWRFTTFMGVMKTVGSHINRLTTKKLSDVLQIESELSQLRYTAKYRTLTKISACCTWAVHFQLISHNPFWVIVDGLKPPKSDKDPDPFTREERDLIIKAYETHPRYSYFAPLVTFLFLTGCRTGEAVALRWKSVTEKYITFCESISVVRGKHIHTNSTKTGKNREFPRTNKSLNKLLKQLKPENVNPDDFVFQQPGGGHINRLTFHYSWYGQKNETKGLVPQGIVSKLARKTEAEGGIDHYHCPYSTRHTFITLALETTAMEKPISHSDISQLARYVGNSPAMIFEHYLGRSGNEKLVNTEFDSPSPQASEDGKPSLDELRAQLATANQRINELTSLVQTLTSSQKLPAPVEPASEPELPLPTPSKTAPPPPPQPNGKALFQKWHPTKPAEEYEQLALFMSLEEMVNPKEE
ncbi:MAG: tyrosine-type recombinase/integrase [Symplocastrum torsivum CPER-KK1]|jgi:integrase|uniref:Tyrosine-type recombinase/integrase n=1 Tax=Symplocastrum torsivum CPER-KK1 TaxID=450513 RepID=A0A951UBC7_9CYAN|nr:tyrosine-type recombinase/integrase [Symplocastrum torsivum CPER-KK1]